jgi:dTMP kinase
MVFELMDRGCFVTLEGIEGSGKTTQAELLAQALRSRGDLVTVTREPGGTRAGELIRAIFLDASVSLERTTELLLVLADRAQHVREQLRPALESGQILISDRYSDSTTAYQGYGRGLDLELVRSLNRLATDGITPELTIVLDCPPELGLERTLARAHGAARPSDRFEGEQIEFHRRVREGFRAIAKENPSRVVLVDSTDETHIVSARILQLFLERLAPRR